MALVFLDIDGTLLPFGSMSADSGSLVEQADPLYGQRLNALGCELVWATTWMDQANELFGPAVGLPPLPVLNPPEPTAEDTYFGLHWKTRGIVERAAGQPFAWIDDEIAETDREWVRDHHSAAALLLRVDPLHGLTAADLDELGAWVASHGSRMG